MATWITRPGTRMALFAVSSYEQLLRFTRCLTSALTSCIGQSTTCKYAPHARGGSSTTLSPRLPARSRQVVARSLIMSRLRSTICVINRQYIRLKSETSMSAVLNHRKPAECGPRLPSHSHGRLANHEKIIVTPATAAILICSRREPACRN
jgi:hypothetical protein